MFVGHLGDCAVQDGAFEEVWVEAISGPPSGSLPVETGNNYSE